MKLTGPEWLIMKALWEKHPARAKEVAQTLPAEISWAYTTIKTMLTRLVAKRAVSESKQGSISIYKPILTRRQARRTALSSVLNQAFDGAFGPLMHFLLEDQNLSAKQRRELLQAIKQENSPKKGGKK